MCVCWSPVWLKLSSDAHAALLFLFIEDEKRSDLYILIWRSCQTSTNKIEWRECKETRGERVRSDFLSSDFTIKCSLWIFSNKNRGVAMEKWWCHFSKSTFNLKKTEIFLSFHRKQIQSQWCRWVCDKQCVTLMWYDVGTVFIVCTCSHLVHIHNPSCIHTVDFYFLFLIRQKTDSYCEKLWLGQTETHHWLLPWKR